MLQYNICEVVVGVNGILEHLLKLQGDVLTFVIPIGGNQEDWKHSCGLLHTFLVR